MGPVWPTSASLAGSPGLEVGFGASLSLGSGHVTCLLVIGKTSHDSGVHDAVQEHGERVDGKAGVV